MALTIHPLRPVWPHPQAPDCEGAHAWPVAATHRIVRRGGHVRTPTGGAMPVAHQFFFCAACATEIAAKAGLDFPAPAPAS